MVRGSGGGAGRRRGGANKENDIFQGEDFKCYEFGSSFVVG